MKLNTIHTDFASRFTLVELILAMSIFAVLMLILMQIFGSTQDVWRKTGAKADSYESARIALNIITEDLNSAIYVSDVAGESFRYVGGDRLWFVTKKPYKIDAAQKSLDVEVLYRLRPYTATENTQEGIPVGLTLNKLEYYITTDAVVDYTATPANSKEYDFQTKTNAHSTVSPATPRGILLDNVISFTVSPLYIYKNGGNMGSKGCGNLLPNMVMISAEVLDSDNAVRTRYLNAATANDKKLISRTFVRVIPIKRGQSYLISDVKLPSEISW